MSVEEEDDKHTSSKRGKDRDSPKVFFPGGTGESPRKGEDKDLDLRWKGERGSLTMRGISKQRGGYRTNWWGGAYFELGRKTYIWGRVLRRAGVIRHQEGVDAGEGGGGWRGNGKNFAGGKGNGPMRAEGMNRLI